MLNYSTKTPYGLDEFNNINLIDFFYFYFLVKNINQIDVKLFYKNQFFFFFCTAHMYMHDNM